MLVSAINEDVDRMAARHGFQVFWLGFLARADGYEMGVPAIPLGELYRASGGGCRRRSLRLRARWMRIAAEGVLAGGQRHSADYYICALPFERLPALGLPGRLSNTPPSPAFICGSTAPSPSCLTPPCSTAPCSGCSTSLKAAICNWW